MTRNTATAALSREEARVAHLGAAYERARNLIAGFGVQVILFLLWVGILIMLYRGVVAPALGGTSYLVRASLAWLLPGVYGDLPPILSSTPPAPLASQSVAILLLCLCGLPKVLTFCVGLALLQRGMDRVRHDFVAGARPGDMDEDRRWDEEQQRVYMEWDFEQKRTHEGIQRVLQYGGFFGFIASAALTTVVLVINGHYDEMMKYQRCLVALAVGSATCVSFAINLARILLRVAHRDASPRMFAWATRSILLVIAGAVLAALLALPGREGDPTAALLKSPLGAVLLGVAVALFGERALQILTDRAAQLLGLPAGRPPAALELLRISGVSDADVERLAEEGIDSLHALAFCTTPRLYFNTTYSLDRICDWQDQALLFTHAGPKAALLREQFLVSGASQAQALAERLLRAAPAPSAAATTPAGSAEPPPAEGAQASAAATEPGGAAAPVIAPAAAPATSASAPAAEPLLLSGPLTAADRDMAVKLLGFATNAQAQVALQVLADDDRARRLRVYRGGGVRRS